jgi:flagellar assembly protein FliH
MSQVRKYAFETEFAPDGAVLTQAPKRFTPEEVEAESKVAYARGSQDAVAQAERQTAAALQALVSAAAALLAQLDHERREIRAEAASIALAAAKTISGAALDAFGVERATASVEAAMDALRHQPRLIVKLPPKDAEVLSTRIAQMAEDHGYGGAILVRSDAKMRAGELVIDWSDGVVGVNPCEITERIEALIAATLAASDLQA